MQQCRVEAGAARRLKDHRPRLTIKTAINSNLLLGPASTQVNWTKVLTSLYQSRQYSYLVRILKDGLADPNSRLERAGSMPTPMLVDAVGRGETDFALELIRLGNIDCNLSREDGTTPLIMAASRGHEKVVEALLSRCGGELELDARNSNGSTALIVSARPGHAGIVRRLLDAGADRTCAQYTGLTALHFACRDGHLEIAELLLDCPSDVAKQILESRDRNEFSPLMYCCQRDHHKVAELILRSDEATQLGGKSRHGTALHVAAMHGSGKALKLLLKSGRLDPSDTDARGRTALDVAKQKGSKSCERILMQSLHPDSASSSDVACCKKFLQLDPTLSEQIAGMPRDEFSLMLHHRMLEAGHSSQRATFQAGAADALAELGNISELRQRFDCRKTSGSFSDGWGGNSQRLNGSVAGSSDVDMSVQQRNPIHVSGWCRCQGVKTYPLEEGFLRLDVVSGDKPSKTDLAVGVRPSMDFCSFRPSCCFPEELRQRMAELPRRFKPPRDIEVEFVRSRRPQCADQMEMRISCTSMEKATLRQMSTCQGQVFVIVKYIFKHVLACGGLKSYHSKTLMFFLLRDIAETEWRADKLEWLVETALLRFERFIIESEDYGDSNCMPHFFIPDAWVYFKTDAEVKRSAIIDCLRAARNHLRAILADYMKQHLRPLRRGENSPFVFHPFCLIELVTPFQRPKIPESGRLTRYRDIYPMVFKILEDIGDPSCAGTRCESLQRDIDSLPDSAATAQAALRVLLHLKLGQLSAAQQALTASDSIRVNREIEFQSCESVEDAKRCVLQLLNGTNSAWKFCFYFNKELDLSFLPASVTFNLLYPLPGHLMLDYSYFVNFDAALKVLRLCLNPDSAGDILTRWYSEMCSAEDGDDIYEWYLFSRFTRNPEQLQHCLTRMEYISVGLDEELDMIGKVEGTLNTRSTAES